MRNRVSMILCFVFVLSLLFAGCQNEPSNITSDVHTHLDDNDDGVCDGCSVSLLINIDLFSINDLHGKFDDTDMQPGVDELSSYLRAQQFGNENTILLSAGDMWQGSSESNLTKGHIITEWMNDMGFTAMALGNHEFDWGEDIIKGNHEIANFPFLAINIYSTETNQRVEYCEPSVFVDLGEIQIGIIGAIGDCYSSIAPDWTKEIYFKTGQELTDLVKAEALSLRQRGADFVVYSLHDGYGGKDYGNTVSDHMISGYYDTSLSNGYVDVVFEGHTHKYYVKQDRFGVYHLQGGGDNQGIVHLDVDINSVTGSFAVNEAKFIATDKYTGSFSDDPIVDSLLEKYNADVNVGKEVLGYNSYNRSSEQLRKIGADLYYDKGMELWGSEYDIVLGGGFFSVRSPGYLKQGDVTYSQLQMIFPFDNKLVLCSIQGQDLRDNFFETDNKNYFISYGEYGADVKSSIDPYATYYVVVDSYTSTYARNRLTEIERYEEEVYLRDLFAEYIKAGSLEN